MIKLLFFFKKYDGKRGRLHNHAQTLRSYTQTTREEALERGEQGLLWLKGRGHLLIELCKHQIWYSFNLKIIMVPPHGLKKEGSTPLSPFQVHCQAQLEEFSRV